MEVSFLDFVKLLNQEVSIFDALDFVGIDYIPGKKDQFISCPFHDEEDPSAKIYAYTNSICCFGKCHRSYGVYNLLKKVFSVKEIISRGEALLKVKVVKDTPSTNLLSEEGSKFTVSSKFNIPVDLDAFLQFAESKLINSSEEDLSDA